MVIRTRGCISRKDETLYIWLAVSFLQHTSIRGMHGMLESKLQLNSKFHWRGSPDREQSHTMCIEREGKDLVEFRARDHVTKAKRLQVSTDIARDYTLIP